MACQRFQVRAHPRQGVAFIVNSHKPLFNQCVWQSNSSDLPAFGSLLSFRYLCPEDAANILNLYSLSTLPGNGLQQAYGLELYGTSLVLP